MIPVGQSNEIYGNRAHLEARCIVCLRIKRRPSEARVEEQIGRLSRNEMRSVFIAWRTVPATAAGRGRNQRVHATNVGTHVAKWNISISL